jgi:hypothetical protein
MMSFDDGKDGEPAPGLEVSIGSDRSIDEPQ